MSLEMAMVRKNSVINMLDDISDKGCGNCGKGLLNNDYTVRCFHKHETYEPFHMCDDYKKCMRVYTMQEEAGKFVSD